MPFEVSCWVAMAPTPPATPKVAKVVIAISDRTASRQALRRRVREPDCLGGSAGGNGEDAAVRSSWSPRADPNTRPIPDLRRSKISHGRCWTDQVRCPAPPLIQSD
jgi:hypothetical protein